MWVVNAADDLNRRGDFRFVTLEPMVVVAVRSSEGKGGTHQPRPADKTVEGRLVTQAAMRSRRSGGHRLTAFATNTARGQLPDLELQHRRRARAEDRIPVAKTPD